MHAPSFCLRGLLEVIVTILLQRRDDAGQGVLSTAKRDAAFAAAALGP